jgi:hypothetical protein
MASLLSYPSCGYLPQGKGSRLRQVDRTPTVTGNDLLATTFNPVIDLVPWRYNPGALVEVTVREQNRRRFYRKVQPGSVANWLPVPKLWPTPW